LIISDGGAFVFIDGRFISPNAENIASFIRDVRVPLKLLCCFMSYIRDKNTNI
jgi:hypothetical protein